MALALIPLTAAAAVTSDPFVIGLWPMALVVVALIAVSAATGQALCLRFQARHLARRQTSPVLPVPAAGRRPR